LTAQKTLDHWHKSRQNQVIGGESAVSMLLMGYDERKPMLISAEQIRFSAAQGPFSAEAFKFSAEENPISAERNRFSAEQEEIKVSVTFIFPMFGSAPSFSMGLLVQLIVENG
jgi:hypothetical protein